MRESLEGSPRKQMMGHQLVVEALISTATDVSTAGVARIVGRCAFSMTAGKSPPRPSEERGTKVGRLL